MPRFKRYLILTILLSQYGYTKIYLSQPGCYKYRGIYTGFENGISSILISPETRGRHVLKVKTSADPKIFNNQIVEGRVYIMQPDLEDNLGVVNSTDLELLAPSTNIKEKWAKVKDEECSATKISKK